MACRENQSTLLLSNKTGSTCRSGSNSHSYSQLDLSLGVWKQLHDLHNKQLVSLWQLTWHSAVFIGLAFIYLFYAFVNYQSTKKDCVGSHLSVGFHLWFSVHFNHYWHVTCIPVNKDPFLSFASKLLSKQAIALKIVINKINEIIKKL